METLINRENILKYGFKSTPSLSEFVIDLPAGPIRARLLYCLNRRKIRFLNKNENVWVEICVAQSIEELDTVYKALSIKH